MIGRRKILTGLGAAALSGCGLSSCGPADTKPGRKNAIVRLRMSWWGGSSAHKATLAALEAFMTRYPHIEVKGEYTGFIGHLERLTTQIAGNTAPDLMQINWYWQALFSRDGTGFFDLNQMSDIIDFSQYDARSLSMGDSHGRRDALSVSNAARLFYVNKTTFDRAGLDVPTTWEGLVASGLAMRDRLGPAYYPIDMTFQDLAGLTRAYVVQKTGKPLVDDTAKQLNCTPDDMAEMAWLYAEMVRKHSLANARYRASFGNVAQQEMRPWINGEFAGAYQWNSAIDKYVDTLKPGQQMVLAPYPMRAGASDAGLLYRPAMMFSINRLTKHPEETALLLNFLMNDPEGVRAMGLKRGIPVSAAARKVLAADGELTGLKQQSEEQIATLPIHVTESPWFEHPRVRDGFQDIFEMQGYGRLTEKEAGRRLYDDINGILQRVVR